MGYLNQQMGCRTDVGLVNRGTGSAEVRSALSELKFGEREQRMQTFDQSSTASTA
jgi:NAD(P)H-flavin reductase